MIELFEVSKAFGDVVALSRLSMFVKPGSITGFLGPNGAGKSTTLKLIMGEIRPDSGKVWISEENGKVHIIPNDNDTFQTDIPKLLAENNLMLKDFFLKESSLQDIFIEVIEGE